jgi:GAF domain-containing protein/HAMP domain-containing protein
MTTTTRPLRSRTRLQNRILSLILGIVVPILIAVVLVSLRFTERTVTTQAEQQLVYVSQGVANLLDSWLSVNNNQLKNLALQPGIISMDPAQQKPILEAMAAANPYMYLVSTTNKIGMNVARSDDNELINYLDRAWFKGAINDYEFTYQILQGRTSGAPALVMSTPIKKDGAIVGVAMFAAELTQVTTAVSQIKIGESGFAFVVDPYNRVMAHPNPEYVAGLQDLQDYPPVTALRAGNAGIYNFTDAEGRNWVSHLTLTPDDWGIIVQLPQSEYIALVNNQRWTALIILSAGVLLVLGLTSAILRQVIRPVKVLTRTAVAISRGDLTRTAPVESDDEIGTLAQTFNKMTAQLRQTVDDLQIRVDERTAELAQALSQLRTAADVSRSITRVMDVQTLLQEVVDLIKERFNLYYVGVFLLDETGEQAILRAGTGEAGSKMVSAGHRLLKGGASMIGWAISKGEARISQEVGTETVRFKNPLLPLTRSEVAIPIFGRDRALGALTIQSTEANAFDQDDIVVLQGVADSLAAALDNAALFNQTQESLDEIRVLNRAYTEEAWARTLANYGNIAVEHHNPAAPPGDQPIRQVRLPLMLRENPIGEVTLDMSGRDLTPDELEFVESITAQAALALESARLLEESQAYALQERKMSEMTSRFSRASNVDDILKAAVSELGNLPTVAEVSIHLVSPDKTGGE